jgi:hypothetical protein
VIPTYIRCDDTVYYANADGSRGKRYQIFDSITEARRWAAQQGKKQPGSVRKERKDPPPAAQLRKEEIAALTRAQQADLRAHRNRELEGAGLQDGILLRPYTMPDRDASSFLRKRSKKRSQLRDARNIHAKYGGS